MPRSRRTRARAEQGWLSLVASGSFHHRARERGGWRVRCVSLNPVFARGAGVVLRFTLGLAVPRVQPMPIKEPLPGCSRSRSPRALSSFLRTSAPLRGCRPLALRCGIKSAWLTLMSSVDVHRSSRGRKGNCLAKSQRMVGKGYPQNGRHRAGITTLVD